MPEKLTRYEEGTLGFVCGKNEGMRQVIDAVMARQRTSSEIQSRAYRSASGMPSLLPYESPVLPVCVARAAGCRITDVDGNEYLDCHMAYTATILGHNPPPVVAAVREALDRGIGAGHLFREQVELAELVLEMVPGTERVSFFHTGGEAIQSAVRFARTVTKKTKVAKFEGCYHGSNEIGLHNTWAILSGQVPNDPLENIPPMAATGGVISRSAEEFLILPYNSPVALELLAQHREELACVVMDPLPTFMTSAPEDAQRFVREVGAATSEYKVPLIFDEVVCGFRLAKGGAREWTGVTPQMSCFGKITSGLGIPLTFVAGEGRFLDAGGTDGTFRDYMTRKAWVASTTSTSFLPIVAALAQLRYLSENYEAIVHRLDDNCRQLRARLADFAQQSGIPAAVHGHPRTQMHLDVGLNPPAEKNYRSAIADVTPSHFRTLFALSYYLRLNGIYTKTIPSMNLSAAHTEQDIELLAKGIATSLQQMAHDGMLES